MATCSAEVDVWRLRRDDPIPSGPAKRRDKQKLHVISSDEEMVDSDVSAVPQS